MQVQKGNKVFYIKGSGSSACLLTGNIDDQPEFIKIQQFYIHDLSIAGLFMVATSEQIDKKTGTKVQSVYFWGNLYAKLIHKPQILEIPTKCWIDRISCGWNHSLLKSRQGLLLGFGQNKFGQLGIHNQKKFHTCPVFLQNYNNEVCAIGAGFRQSYWSCVNGTVYGCGQSKNNELGVINKIQLIPATAIKLQNKEHQKLKINKFQCGKKFMVALLQNGEVIGVGSNNYHCLIRSQIQSFQSLKLLRQGIVDVGCGWSHIIMCDLKGKVLSQGRNNFGQLGREENQNEYTVNLPHKCKKVVVGTQFSFALLESGEVYGWGWNEHQNILNTQASIINVPTKIPIDPQLHIQKIYTHPAITAVEITLLNP